MLAFGVTPLPRPLTLLLLLPLPTPTPLPVACVQLHPAPRFLPIALYRPTSTSDLRGLPPGNELILNVLKLQWKLRDGLERRHGWLRAFDHMSLVWAFSFSLEEDLFGHRVQHGNETVWDSVRKAITDSSGGMIVTKKDMWCDGFLIRDYEGCKSVGRESLYEAYNIKPWANHVDDVWYGKVPPDQQEQVRIP